MNSLPSGTVTFLFTDIEGSTALLQRLGDRRYAEILKEYHRLLREAFTERNGQEIDTQGDAFVVAFSSARDAVGAAVAAQRALASRSFPDDASLQVRMGLHTGEPVTGTEDYVGLDVHRAARICSACHGGQILLSDAVSGLVARDLPPGVSLRDLGTHRLKDLKEPEHLLQVVHPDLRTDFPPLKSLNVLPNNLSVQLTSFIGREREMLEVKHMLASSRLVTLTGSGGCGKTRLALQIAAHLLEEYADGVWLVELGALSDPSLVPQTVASALSVPEHLGRPLGEVLADYLRAKALFLVLDNCEQVVEACARLAEALLRACPGLQILATSREPLNLAGEVTFRVPSLSLPDPREVVVQERVVKYEAVRLFLDRARLVRPAFAITDQNVQSVTKVCRQLDGIPLAIELAAARVKVLSADQIAARLDDRFHLLIGGSRTALPRQQTLRAAMDWSYDLLGEKERALLNRLSVFAGGWTLEAAEAVCAGESISREEILDLLARLADKSLIIVEQWNGEPRYRQLDTVRQYSQDRLLASGEAPAVRDKHREWFLSLAEQAEPELVGANPAEWFSRLDAEIDNLRAALEWSLKREGAEAALRLASAVTRFWLARGYSAEGRVWIETGLSRCRDRKGPVCAKALNAVGYLAIQGQNDYTSGRAFFEEGLAAWREVGDKKGVAASLHWLGLVATYQGDDATARSLYEESLTIRQEVGDKGGIALTLHNLGMQAYRLGDDAARPLLERALALWRELEYMQDITNALTGLGLVVAREGDYARAHSLHVESLLIRQKLGDKWGIVYDLEGCAGLAAAEGHPHRAAQLFGAAEALRESFHAPVPPVYRVIYDRHVATVRAELDKEAFEAAWGEGRTMGLDHAVAEAMRTGACD